MRTGRIGWSYWPTCQAGRMGWLACECQLSTTSGVGTNTISAPRYVQWWRVVCETSCMQMDSVQPPSLSSGVGYTFPSRERRCSHALRQSSGGRGSNAEPAKRPRGNAMRSPPLPPHPPDPVGGIDSRPLASIPSQPFSTLLQFQLQPSGNCQSTSTRSNVFSSLQLHPLDT